MVTQNIPFKLKSIETLQFATFEENLIENEVVQLKIGIRFDINQSNRLVACFCNVQFLCKELPIIKTELVCEFEVKEQEWFELIDAETKQIHFAPNFLRHLAMLTIGTLRGVLHAKTENKKFNNYFLPTINIEQIIEDRTVKFNLD